MGSHLFGGLETSTLVVLTGAIGDRLLHAGLRAPEMTSHKSSAPDEGFIIERHGDLTIITATEAVERIDFGLEEQVAELILKPLRRQDNPSIVFDLTSAESFGSMFLALMIRCWKLALSQGGTMALCGVSDRTRELLRVTALDMVWPIYESKREAMEALQLD